MAVVVSECFWLSPECLHFKYVLLFLLYKCIVLLPVSQFIVSYVSFVILGGGGVQTYKKGRHLNASLNNFCFVLAACSIFLMD